MKLKSLIQLYRQNLRIHQKTQKEEIKHYDYYAIIIIVLVLTMLILPYVNEYLPDGFNTKERYQPFFNYHVFDSSGTEGITAQNYIYMLFNRVEKTILCVLIVMLSFKIKTPHPYLLSFLRIPLFYNLAKTFTYIYNYNRYPSEYDIIVLTIIIFLVIFRKDK